MWFVVVCCFVLLLKEFDVVGWSDTGRVGGGVGRGGLRYLSMGT